MNCEAQLAALELEIAKIKRQNRAGVSLIVPDADGFVLICTAGVTRQETHFPAEEAAQRRCLQTHTTPAESPLIIVDV